jgi:hypothetical protein
MLYISSLISHLQQIRVDGGKEFLTNNIKDLCCEFEIELKRTEPYEHAQAGQVENNMVLLTLWFELG